MQTATWTSGFCFGIHNGLGYWNGQARLYRPTAAQPLALLVPRTLDSFRVAPFLCATGRNLWCLALAAVFEAEIGKVAFKLASGAILGML